MNNLNDMNVPLPLYKFLMDKFQLKVVQRLKILGCVSTHASVMFFPL